QPGGGVPGQRPVEVLHRRWCRAARPALIAGRVDDPLGAMAHAADRSVAPPGNDRAPESVGSRGHAIDAQVASRRKAQHGSSRTVFHEGSELSPGDTNAPTGGKNAKVASTIPAVPGQRPAL